MFAESNKILEDARRHRLTANSETQKAIRLESMYIPALAKDAKCLEGSWFVTRDADDGHTKFYHCVKILPYKIIPWGSDTVDNYFTDRLSIFFDAIGVVFKEDSGRVWHGKHEAKISPSELRNAQQMTWEEIKKTYNVHEETYDGKGN
jgi:hypothetical protein